MLDVTVQVAGVTEREPVMVEVGLERLASANTIVIPNENRIPKAKKPTQVEILVEYINVISYDIIDIDTQRATKWLSRH